MYMAATAAPPNPLQVFALALDLIAHEQLPLSAPLKEYFERLLGDAKRLIDDPGNAALVAPEALILASTLAKEAELQADLRDIQKAEEVSPSKALRLRRAMEEQIAA